MKFKKFICTLCLSFVTITGVTAFSAPIQAMDLTQTLTQTVLGDITIEVPNYGTIKSDNLTLTKVSDKEIYVSTSSKQMQSDFNFDSFSKGLETSLKALPDKYISTIQNGTLKSMPAVVASINTGNSGLILVNFYSNNTVHNVNILYAGPENYKEAYSLIAKISLTSGKESIVIKPSTPTTHVDLKSITFDLPSDMVEDAEFLNDTRTVPFNYSGQNGKAYTSKTNPNIHYVYGTKDFGFFDLTYYRRNSNLAKEFSEELYKAIKVNSETVNTGSHDNNKDNPCALLYYESKTYTGTVYLIVDPKVNVVRYFKLFNTNPDSSKRDEGYDEFLEFIKTIKIK